MKVLDVVSRFAVVGLALMGHIGWAHTSMTSPTPRPGTTDGTKTSNSVTNPCGGIARGNSPLVMTAGSQLTMSWVETINHPGRFIVQFSAANDQDFDLAANELYRKEDTEDKGSHIATVKLPNIPCEACTLRLVQEMDDQPATKYVNCADIRLTAASTNPTPNSGGGGQSSQNSNANIGTEKSKMPGGCALAAGQIATIEQESSRGDTSKIESEVILYVMLFTYALIWLMPVLFLFKLRSRSAFGG